MYDYLGDLFCSFLTFTQSFKFINVIFPLLDLVV